MTTPKIAKPIYADLRMMLYAGIALIVASLALMVRDARATELQAVIMFGSPALFFGVGIAALRLGKSPFAAAGIVTTGAWLTAVTLVYASLWRQPNGVDTWWVQSGLVMIVITAAGHHVRFGLLYPLVLLVQVNAMWATMGALGIEPQWLTPLSFILVAVWWWGTALVVRDTTRKRMYRIGAGVLIAFLVGLSLFLRANASVSPLSTSITLMMGGIAVLIIGGERWRLAAHGGVWLIAAGWITFYLDWLGDSGAFGLWLALFAAGALLTERVLTSQREGKKKGESTLYQAVTRWALADVSLGLSVIIILWTAGNLDAAPPLVMIVTLAVTCGVWIVGGLVYRLPALLHAALWIFPLPFGLLLTLMAPQLWALHLMGMEWQMLALVYLGLGHMMRRRRPSVRLPFFVAGYAYVLFGLVLTWNSTTWMPISLGVAALVTCITAWLALTERHHVWEWAVDTLIRRKKYPVFNESARHVFVLLAAWLTAYWVTVVLTFAGLSGAQPGLAAVTMSAAWLTFARLLLPHHRMAGWMVYSAGWWLWASGLLSTSAPLDRSALILIIGLIFCGEAVWHTRASFWLPLVLLHGAYVALHITRMLILDWMLLALIVATVVTVYGLKRIRKWWMLALLNVLIVWLLFELGDRTHTHTWLIMFGVLTVVNGMLAVWIRNARAWYPAITTGLAAALILGFQVPQIWDVYLVMMVIGLLVWFVRTGVLIPILLTVTVTALTLIVFQGIMQIARVNVWLIPLGIGVGLLSAAVYIEWRGQRPVRFPPPVQPEFREGE